MSPICKMESTISSSKSLTGVYTSISILFDILYFSDFTVINDFPELTPNISPFSSITATLVSLDEYITFLFSAFSGNTSTFN